MPPVRIKYYGLIPMTKRAYVIALAGSGLFALIVVVTAAMLGLLPALDTMWSREHRLPNPSVFALVYNYFYWIVLICLLAQALDVLVTLRAFAKKEAEQRSQSESIAIRAGEPPT